MYIHLRQQLKLYGKYTFISTSMNFINADEFSRTLFANILTFNSINVCRHKWKSHDHLGRDLALPVTVFLLLLYGHGLLVFLEDAVSILDLSVLVLAGNFRLKCHSGNSSFHHLLEHDLLLLVVSPRSFTLASIVLRYFLPLFGLLR